MRFILLLDPDTEQIREDQIMLIDDSGIIMSVPNEPKNRHWQMYQAWLLEGNEPEQPE